MKKLSYMLKQLWRAFMPRIIVDGNDIVGGRTIQISGDMVIVDGVIVEGVQLKQHSEIRILEGSIDSLVSDRNVVVVARPGGAASVGGSVKAGGNVTCDNVGGSVDARGNVACDNVGGDVRADGNVSADDVRGNVTAGGNVNCDDVEGSVTGAIVRHG